MQSVIRFRHICYFLFFLGVSILSCKKNDIATSSPAPDTHKLITAFNFGHATNVAYLNVDVNGSIGTDTITLTVPVETAINNLVPTISFTGASISPLSGTAQNFSTPVSYTVTAEDGSTKKYTVLVAYRNTVFICVHKTMYALDGMTGQEIWSVGNTNFNSGTPSVSNGTVYICGDDGLYALDEKTGSLKWKYPFTATPTYQFYQPSPVVANNTVFISVWDGFVYAINTTDGSLKWRTQSTAGAAFYSNVTVNNNLLYTGCADHYLYTINTANGAIMWKFLTGDVIYKNPLVVNNNVLTSGLNGTQYFLNGTTGAVIWTTPNDLLISSYTYNNGVLYTGGGTRGDGFDVTTGQLVWQLSVNIANLERSSPVVLDGKIYSGSNNGNFYAYDIASNNEIWSYPTNGSGVFSSPVIADGILFIGSIGQEIIAVDAATGTLRWNKPVAGYVYGSACVIDTKGIKHYPGVSGEQN